MPLFGRPTPAQYAAVASALLAATEPPGATDISRAAGVPPRRACQVLDGLMDSGWVIDDWEDITVGQKRRPRRYYVAKDPEALRALVAGS